MKSLTFVLLIKVLACIRDSEGLSRPSTMTLENNEFKNVVIAIHESVPEDKALIDTLKNTMTKASKYLYTATRERAFFKEIKILLPSTWSNDATYAIPTSENLAFADVIITDPIRGKRSLPQARSYDGCGKQGVHVLLSKEFLTIPRIEPYFNDPAKYFIHAFAQFRWGVFQEYAEEGESEFYISVTTGRPEAIRCTIMLRGLVQKNDSAHTICYLPIQAQNAHVVASVDNVTGLYERECLWRPYPTRQRTKASIMDHQYITNIETFCDDNHTNYMTEHNFEAPSKHNRLCGHRSTWDIITNTDDFRNGRNLPHGRLDAQLEPTFIIMRAPARKRRAAILIDPALINQNDIYQTIGYLKDESTIHDLEIVLVKHVNRVVSHQILQSIESVGTFLEQHSLNYNDSFTDQITIVAQMLEKEARENVTHLILVTHQKSTELQKKLTESDQSGLKLSAILIKSSAVIASLGNLHTVGNEAGNTLLDRLRNIILEETPRKIVITADRINLSNMVPVLNSVSIDPTLTNHLTFIFHYDIDQPNIDLRSPSGVIYGVEDDICTVDNDLRVIKFHLEFTEVGTWTYKVMQTTTSSQNVRVTVISEEEINKIDPLVLKQSVQIDNKHKHVLLLHVDAMHGTSPLTDLTVVARIETPKGMIEYVHLLDNGAGVDVSKNDGIYSRTYIAPRINGLYHVSYMVTNNHEDGKRQNKSYIRVKEDMAYTKKEKIRSLDGHSFERQISGGTIHINNIGVHSPNNDGSQVDDVVPPSRIADLQAMKFIPYRNSIVLKWTTPGNDFDHGKPSGYHLYIGYDINDVRSFLKYIASGIYDGTGNVAHETLTGNSSATETEIYLWNVTKSAKTYVFAVRAFDESGNIGEISNVATTSTVVRQ